jgi:hypothetical protein
VFLFVFSRHLCLTARILLLRMKPKKKKLALPRRQWTINPVTRVKESDKKYARSRVKKDGRKYEE